MLTVSKWFFFPTAKCFKFTRWDMWPLNNNGLNVKVWIKLQFSLHRYSHLCNFTMKISVSWFSKWHIDNNMCRDMRSSQSNAALCWSEVLEHVYSKPWVLSHTDLRSHCHTNRESEREWETVREREWASFKYQQCPWEIITHTSLGFYFLLFLRSHLSSFFFFFKPLLWVQSHTLSYTWLPDGLRALSSLI